MLCDGFVERGVVHLAGVVSTLAPGGEGEVQEAGDGEGAVRVGGEGPGLRPVGELVSVCKPGHLDGAGVEVQRRAGEPDPLGGGGHGLRSHPDPRTSFHGQVGRATLDYLNRRGYFKGHPAEIDVRIIDL